MGKPIQAWFCHKWALEEKAYRYIIILNPGIAGLKEVNFILDFKSSYILGIKKGDQMREAIMGAAK